MPCPVEPSDARLGDGLCDDALNIRACGYDGGDCCSSTCKPSLLDGSCALSTFNCRDSGASRDTTPPKIVAPVHFTRTFTWLNTSNPDRAIEAAAVDNFPCFVPHITINDTKIGGEDCGQGVWYVLRRTYSATDRAGNVGRAVATLTILDDVPPQLLNTPQPRNTTMNSTFVRGGAMANATKVSRPVCFACACPKDDMQKAAATVPVATDRT